MNKQIYGYVYMAVFNNPAAVILSVKRRINIKQFLRWAILISRSHLTPICKRGWQFKAPASVAVIGTIMQLTYAVPTATTQQTLTVIVTIITVVVVFGWRLSRGCRIIQKMT
jgi:hypothetical protein